MALGYTTESGSTNQAKLGRRRFLAAAGGVAFASNLAHGQKAATPAAGEPAAPADEPKAKPEAPAEPAKPKPKHQFKLKYAPHLNMFRHLAGPKYLDQLKFAADQGFTAWEDNGMMRRPPKEQEEIAETMMKLGLTMGVFVAEGNFNKPTSTGRDKQLREGVLKKMDEAVATAKRVNAKWMTVVPGAYDRGTEWDYQTANCIDLLKRCCERLEPAGFVMVLEPLNWWANHPGLFLHKIPQAYLICKAVGSPSCKILFDLYHQQITEGNLIPNIDKAWSEIAYFQCGDNPGRKEPGTGEINYRRVFQHLHAKGFAGVMGMEHGNSRKGPEGDQAVIDAYVAADDF
ncbi:MAG: TIM barrel protein [Planctomycetota bacterium]